MFTIRQKNYSKSDLKYFPGKLSLPKAKSLAKKKIDAKEIRELFKSAPFIPQNRCMSDLKKFSEKKKKQIRHSIRPHA